MTIIDCANKDIPVIDHASVIDKLQKWLGSDGISFFRKVKKEYGRIDACWIEGEFDKTDDISQAEMNCLQIPHIVHFREGMQVRNFLRTIYADTWTSHDYDDRWVQLIEEAIKE